ncbi:hypothetical protein RFI_35592, partial [Reticulomyxa filosa]
EDYESPKKKSIEDELNKWKIQIRLEQDKYNPAVQCLNEEDVKLFFETVPSGEDYVLNVVTSGKELIVIDLFLLIEPMICPKSFRSKLLFVCFCLFDVQFKQGTFIILSNVKVCIFF